MSAFTLPFLPYCSFFASYPAYQKLFGEFADVPHDELVENGKFKAHAFTLVNLLNGLVENVDDPELFSYVLVKQGKNHAQHSLKASDFEVSPLDHSRFPYSAA